MSKMLDALILSAARESLKMYGFAIPPQGETQQVAMIRKGGKMPTEAETKKALGFEALQRFGEAKPPFWAMLPTMRRYCTYCEGEFPALEHFGPLLHKVHGQILQPTCRKYRASKESHPTRYGMPRKTTRAKRPPGKP